MTHADAFLHDILAHPDDDAPRLIFADWLEEQGDANSIARAEFIRIQCALAAGHLPRQRQSELERRWQQILEEFGEEWSRPVRRLLRGCAFHRGFIDEVWVRSDKFVGYANRLFRRAPIQHLHLVPRLVSHTISSDSRFRMSTFVDCIHLQLLRSLHLSYNRLDSNDVRALVVSNNLTRLTSLDLSSNRIGDSGIRALASSPLLARLEHLNLCGNDFGAGSLRALEQALEQLDRCPEGLCLQRVELYYDNLSVAGQRVIANSFLLRRLVRV